MEYLNKKSTFALLQDRTRLKSKIYSNQKFTYLKKNLSKTQTNILLQPRLDQKFTYPRLKLITYQRSNPTIYLSQTHTNKLIIQDSRPKIYLSKTKIKNYVSKTHTKNLLTHKTQNKKTVFIPDIYQRFFYSRLIGQIVLTKTFTKKITNQTQFNNLSKTKTKHLFIQNKPSIYLSNARTKKYLSKILVKTFASPRRKPKKFTHPRLAPKIYLSKSHTKKKNVFIYLILKPKKMYLSKT